MLKYDQIIQAYTRLIISCLSFSHTLKSRVWLMSWPDSKMDQIGTWTKDIWGIYRNGIYHITKTIISRIIGSNMETVGITAKSLLFSSIFFLPFPFSSVTICTWVEIENENRLVRSFHDSFHLVVQELSIHIEEVLPSLDAVMQYRDAIIRRCRTPVRPCADNPFEEGIQVYWGD